MPQVSQNIAGSRDHSDLRLLKAPELQPEWYTQAHADRFKDFRNERLLVRLNREVEARRKLRHSTICETRDAVRDTQLADTFTQLSVKFSAPSADARQGMIHAARQLRQMTGAETLAGKRVLDLFSGSAVADPVYQDTSSLERYSPWFARLCTSKGADVLAIDSRPQADGEEFQSLVFDLSSPLRTQALLADLGKFDLIHGSRPGWTSFKRQSGKFCEKRFDRWRAAMEPILRRALKSGGALYWDGTISRVV